jgi:hypothetical protein
MIQALENIDVKPHKTNVNTYCKLILFNISAKFLGSGI